jgi:hypothetical protein
MFTPMDSSYRYSRRSLLVATGAGLGTGCLGKESSDSPPAEPATDPPTEPPTTTAVGTPTTTEEGDTIHVDDYGATPDDENDDTEAVLEAFEMADSTGATLRFGAGTYYLASPDDEYRVSRGRTDLAAPLFDLENYTDLTVTGDETTLQLANWSPVFLLQGSTGVTIEGLTVDWARDLPFTEGHVVAETPEYVDLDVRDGFEARADIPADSFFFWEEDRGRVAMPFYNQKHEAADNLTTVLDDGVLRCPKAETVPDDFTTYDSPVQEGDALIVRHRVFGGGLFILRGCEDTTIRNVTCHTTPGRAVSVKRQEDLLIENLSLVPADDRWFGVAAGGLNIRDTAGELTLRGLTVESTGDDFTNFNVIRHTIKEVRDERTLLVNLGLGANEDLAYHGWQEGHEVAICTGPEILTPQMAATIESARVEVEQIRDFVGRASLTLSVDRPIPDAVASAETAQVYNTHWLPDRALIENMSVAHIRGGGRFRVPNTIIRDSTFEDVPGAANWFGAQIHAGVPPSNSTIEGNTFRNTPYRPGSDAGAVVTAQGVPNKFEVPAGTVTNLEIRDNTFEHDQADNPAMILESLSESTVTGNDFSAMATDTPIVVGDHVDCETVTIDGQTACDL